MMTRIFSPGWLFVAAFALITSAPVQALERAVPQSQAQVQLSFAPIVREAAPAVVNVYASRVERRAQNPFFDDPFFRQFFGGDFGVPRQRVMQSLGSGVIIDPAGLVVTNNHVIDNMTDVKVALADKREYEASIVLRDPRTDLAVLRIKGKGPFPTMQIGDSDAIQVGDLVLAIGNPFGVGQTVTQGIVSALARTHVGVGNYSFFIQTDAAINPGNSGGALVDMQGRLIGINSAIFSKSGGSLGIGFAIPSAMVKVVVAAAKNGGKTVPRPWVGAQMQAVTQDIADSIGLDRPVGALVTNVVPDGPAAKSGLKSGDVILALDGQEVEDPNAFGYRLATHELGGTVSMKVLRGKQTLTLAMKLVPAPETVAPDPVRLSGRTPLAGATVANLSPALAEQLSMDLSATGVVVTKVEEGTNASQVGFQKGDIVVAVNGTKVKTSRELAKLMASPQRYWEMTIDRGGQITTTVVGG